MYWKLTAESPATDAQAPPKAARRYVLHRHHDPQGPHLDLRLEQDGYLLGWRIDADTLDGEIWAEEKPPHPCRWLDHDGDAVRIEAGTYAWVRHDAEGGMLDLYPAGAAPRSLTLQRIHALAPSQARDLIETIAREGIRGEQVPALLRDGLCARRRAIERFRGLGRELDGAAFDATLWRRTLEACTLDEIHGHLRSFEVRFDLAYPPTPVSKPEPLDTATDTPRAKLALSIAQG